MSEDTEIAGEAYDGHAAFNRRALILRTIVIGGLAFLVLVLINLQLFHGKKYRKQAIANATWHVPETPVEERARDAMIGRKP